MKYTFAAILILAALIISPVLASDVTLKSSQSEYTFPAGEEARVPFVVESSFPKTNVGTLEYTLTRKQSQGGVSFSQSSSHTQSFPISPGSSQNAITLSSDDPAVFEVSLAMHYRDSGKDYISTLPPFNVQFVPNQSPQQGTQGSSQTSQSAGNSGSPLTSSTSEEKPAAQSQSSDPFDEMDRQMNAMQQQNQQLMQQMLSSQGVSSGAGSRSQPQTAQQALQNNQMNTESSALQKQLAQETAQSKKDQQNLQDNLENDPLISKMKQILEQSGYQKKNYQVRPDEKQNGTLISSYENKSGQIVDIKGNIQNGSVTEVDLVW